jgi:hypothetical protein
MQEECRVMVSERKVVSKVLELNNEQITEETGWN